MPSLGDAEAALAAVGRDAAAGLSSAMALQEALQQVLASSPFKNAIRTPYPF